MNFRKIISLIVLVSFLLLVLTGIVLFIVPHGRVAYWSNWTLWGLSKDEWTNLHISLALLFFISGTFHIYYNWDPMISYLKNDKKRLVVFTGEFVTALLVTLFAVMTTQYGLPPLRWVLDLNESVKAEAGRLYGEPPYGHAERSTLDTLAARMGLDLEKSLASISSAGFRVEKPADTLSEVALSNGVTPQQIYQAMLQAEKAGGTGPAPALFPKPGKGRRLLADVCEESRLNVSDVLRILSDHGISAAPDESLKAIADRNDTSPGQVYEIIQSAAGR
jgi:hypothetical protein